MTQSRSESPSFYPQHLWAEVGDPLPVRWSNGLTHGSYVPVIQDKSNEVARQQLMMFMAISAPCNHNSLIKC